MGMYGHVWACMRAVGQSLLEVVMKSSGGYGLMHDDKKQNLFKYIFL